MPALPDFAFEPFDGAVKRMVERQESSATASISDDPQEHELLEALIERSKPGELNANVHYLLGTPFRYPPLLFGSRFGSRSERWIFYASLDVDTCLRECSYYRFLLLFDMDVPPPNPIAAEHTMFSVELESNRCVNLGADTWNAYRDELCSVQSYRFTQQVGAAAREDGAEMLRVPSARAAGENVAVLEDSAFSSRPFDQELWMSQTRADRIMFRGPAGVFQFGVDQFTLADGNFARIET